MISHRYKHFVVAVLGVSLLNACADRATLVGPSLLPSTAAATAAPANDLVTHDPQALAARVRAIGNNNELIVWVKDHGTAPRAPDLFVEAANHSTRSIGLPLPAAGQEPRRTVGKAPRDRGAMDGLVRTLAGHGVRVRDQGEHLPYVTLRAPDSLLVSTLTLLLRHPAVDYVQANEPQPARRMTVSASRTVATSSEPIDRKLTIHGVERAWPLTRGRGVKVGILDSGLAGFAGTGTYHEDAARIFDSTGSYGVIPLGFVDDIEGSPGTSGGGYAYDDQSHGTAMVGLVGANPNGLGAIGVLPEGLTYSMKMAFNTHVRAAWHCGFWYGNEDYFCIEPDDVLRAVDFACSNGIKVLSMSWGRDDSSIHDALHHAYYDCDILLLAAVGNQPEDAGTAPASYPFVMGVGAIDTDGDPIGLSTNVDVRGFSGGYSTRAACSGASYCTPDGYEVVEGTSASTATAAGIAGLLRAYEPGLSAQQAWLRLVNTATRATRLDAYAALLNIIPLSAAVSGPTSVLPGETATWTVQASHGSAPYRYNWFVNGQSVAGGTTYTTQVNTRLEIEVAVADDAGAFTSATYSVFLQECADPNHDHCTNE